MCGLERELIKFADKRKMQMMTKVIPEPERAVKRDGRSDATKVNRPKRNLIPGPKRLS